MKKVFDNAMVAHVWAQQSQSEGRSHNGNFSFHDTVLVSYQTPIANMVKSITGERVTLLTSETYSVTTSGKHMNPTWRAIDYGKSVPAFSVPHLLDGWITPENVRGQHAANLEWMKTTYAGTIGKMRRARDCGEWMYNRLQEQAETAARYASTFGLDAPGLDAEKDAAAIREFRAARDARNNTPAAIAKREKEKTRRVERVRENFRAGKLLPGSYSHQRALERSMSPEDHAARATSIRVALAEKIAKWNAGEFVGGLRFDAESGGAALRAVQVERDAAGNITAGELETSHGASVPLVHAIRAFRFLKLCRDTGRVWDRNGRSIRVGHFTIDHVDADGSFCAGCHHIAWGEVERIARVLGVFDMPALDTTEPTGAAA